MAGCPDRLGVVIDTLLRDHPRATFYAHGWSNRYPLVDFWYYTFDHDWREVRRARGFKVAVSVRRAGTRVEITDPVAFPDERNTFEVSW